MKDSAKLFRIKAIIVTGCILCCLCNELLLTNFPGLSNCLILIAYFAFGDILEALLRFMLLELHCGTF